jgi:hypothetical protein
MTNQKVEFPLKDTFFIEVVRNSGLTINSNLKLTNTNSSLEYLTKKSTLKSIGVDSNIFKVDLSRVDSGLESTHQDSIPKSIGVDYRIRVIMIGCVFIQTNELMLKGQKFIYTSKIICATNIRFKHPNFDIKEGTIHSISPFFQVLLRYKNPY